MDWLGVEVVSAGAGTGKTKVLVERFARAVCDEGVDVESILVITYTEKAAGELRSRIRSKRKKEKILAEKGPGKRVPVTVSIGVAERDDRYSKPDQVVKAADRALYRAKDGGRNQVRT